MDNYQKKASIIIPAFNKSEFTDQCINKIYQNTTSDFDFEIIVVDNASTDNTEDILSSWKKKKGNIRYVKLEKNYRFGYACNFGASLAGGDILVFLNNDTEPQKNWLITAVNRLLSNDKIGIVGSKLLYPDGTIQHCGIDFFNDVNPLYKIWPLHRYLNSNPEDPVVNVAEEVPAVTGAALFIKKSLFFVLEKFDLKYKMYFEDTDLCFKAKSKGYKIFYEPESVLIHHEGKSSSNQEEINKFNKESAKRFYSKWNNEIKNLEKELEFVEERNHFYTVFRSDIYPQNYIIRKYDAPAKIDTELFKNFFLKLLTLGKAYYHFGGAGDALLLLSTFYDENPNNILISFANSVTALKSFFSAFTELKHIYILPIPEDPLLNGYIRKLLPGFSNVLGMGVTPSDAYENEWNNGINIFEDYKVNKTPRWCQNFFSEKLEKFQVVVAPMGSNFGMFKSKKNIIEPDDWHKIIEFLKNQDIKPVVIGVPTEEELYPILPGCIDKRSYSFQEQMGIISVSDIFIGADSWGKTFSSLAGIQTIVFQALRGEDLNGWKDNSDYIFLDPWDNITVIKNIEDFFTTFDKIKNEITRNNSNRYKTIDKELLLSKDEIISARYDLQVIWNAPIFDNSGYADESRNFVLGLKQEGIKLKLNSIRWANSVAQLPQETKRTLERSTRSKLDYSTYTFNIFHIFPPHFKRSSKFFNIGRTMFETDRIPTEWVEKCNEMDEIWVPSDFNVATFHNSGVVKEKLVKIPESIDLNIYNDQNSKLYDLKNIKGFKFLSVFDWNLRKGWDVLIRAFSEEFLGNKNVYLILKIWSSYGKSIKEIKNDLKKYLRKKNLSEKIFSQVIFYKKNLSIVDLPKLYNSVDAFVLPTRGEGWGRPMMEAMAMEVPTIATKWSGQLEFMNDDNSFLIDYKLVDIPPEACKETPAFKGHKWAEPSVEHLKKIMREVFEDKEGAIKKAKIARKFISEYYNRETVAKIIYKRLKEIKKSINKFNHSNEVKISSIENTVFTKESKLNNLYQNLVIRWFGLFDGNSSLSLVNKNLNSLLSKNGLNIELFNPDSKVEKNEKKDSLINIYHHFPPNLTPPESGKWVIIQPWEFGSLPKSWVETFSAKVDEMWIPSNYVKQVYVESGIPEDKVFVIPNGFNPKIFNIDKSDIKLKTRKKFKFLFVGGTIYRKGIDILLKAYTELFTSVDDVVLIIKDMGGDSFYNGQTFTTQINEIIKDKSLPEIEYINKFLTVEELKGLYQTSDVLVQPYRGEGFGLPILESMACGTPVIVTNGGAALDFCNSENSFLLKAEKSFYKEKKVGKLETVDHPWLYEVPLNELVSKMKYVTEHIDEIKEKGSKAFEFVHSNFTWEKSTEKIIERIKLLSMKPIFRNEREEKEALFFKYINDVFNLINKGKYYDALNSMNLAMENYNHSQSNENKIKIDELLIIKGNLFLVTNNLEKARENFEEALNQNPTSSQACQGLGELFTKVEKYEAAKTMYEWAVLNDTQNKTAKAGLANVNNKLGFPEDHNSVIEEQSNIENQKSSVVENE